MSIPLQITFKDLDTSTALEARIREKTDWLARFNPGILWCNVTIESPHRHNRKGRVYAVHIEIGVRGDTIVVSREHRQDHAHEDPYLAMRDAFQAAARQLEDKARKVNGRVKHHESPLMTGRIDSLVAGQDYGFIATSEGDVYFHRNSVAESGFDRLCVGEEVRLAAVEGEKGLQATTVYPLGKHHPTPES